MARENPVRSQTDTTTDDRLPNLITIVGRGVPSMFEIAVDGELEMLGDDPAEDATVVSQKVAEGTIDVGVRRFRFSGRMANVTVVDWNGVPAPDSPSTPTIHIDYDVPDR
ncbi:hypothetical protein EA462_08215 [Natrarchaeobius halalkaliphilus]|uniref:Uncharacterized protein n=1 Tax=Natrarchaeobius halalkaliphilus TaxID=1679091 RepID=A0A3N6M431_9EURY|nr:hypothetical protein [Natrarchaeobius halalkaliphilus]RQG89981.1 hypothetical protein EA462_08215 [Natrarchaeobius halalkaliphilus]